MASRTSLTSLGNKPFASPFYSIGKEICQNMYLEVSQSSEAKSNFYLLKIAGLKLFAPVDPINLGGVRALMTTGGYRTFTVVGNKFMEIIQDGSKMLRGTINSINGVVSIADNGYQLILVDGMDGWIFDYVHNTFLRISDENFPGSSKGSSAPTHVAYIDTYFIVNDPASNKYYWSESYYQSYNTTTDETVDYDWTGVITQGYWSGLNFGQKVGKADYISALANVNNYLWLFGYNSNEIHYDTGDFNNQLFARYEGAILNYGCKSPNSVATYGNNVFWLGSDNAGTLGVFTNEGMIPKRISLRGIEQIIQEFDVYSDCIGYTYSQAGHSFYVMQFPTESRTFVYDLVTDAWHERTYLDENGELSAWRGMFATNNFDRMMIGDRIWSTIYDSDTTYYQNDNPDGIGVNYIRCVKNTPILFSNGVNVRYDWVQVICNQGSGTNVNTPAGVGKDPTVQIAFSDNTGISYGNERTAPLGMIGDYTKRSKVLACGMGRNRVIRITMTDPVPFILVALLINGQECSF